MPRKPRKQLSRAESENIGKRLATIRKKNGYTQKDLAKIMSLERASISNYEIGRIHLYDEIIIEFANALNVSTDEILGLKQDSENMDEIDFQLKRKLEGIKELPVEQKQSLMNTIEAYLKANS